MKKVLLLLLFVFCLFLVATPVFAQGPTLPDTASELVATLAAILGGTGLAGLLANRTTERLKSAIPFLTSEEHDKLSSAFVELTAVVVALVSGYLIAYLTPIASYLDNSGAWAVVMFAWPMAWGMFQIDKRRINDFSLFPDFEVEQETIIEEV